MGRCRRPADRFPIGCGILVTTANIVGGLPGQRLFSTDVLFRPWHGACDLESSVRSCPTHNSVP